MIYLLVLPPEQKPPQQNFFVKNACVFQLLERSFFPLENT